MKLRKILGIILAVAMISTLALSASATITADIPKAETGFVRIDVSGDRVDPASNSIHPNLIKKVRVTFTIDDYEDCDSDCAGCIGLAWNSEKTGWVETFKNGICYKNQKVITADLSAVKDEELQWLSIHPAIWDKDMSGKALIEALDANGAVLALGAQPVVATSAATGTATNAPTTTAATGGAAPKTGVGGVLALGGMAILAAGAVVISRRKK